MSQQFDVVVIGGGPGGYIAAIRAAQLGFKVACIDEWKNASGGPAPGGTCTNVGCIPSKALLQSSEHFDHANHHFAEHGITATGVKMDIAKMLARKDTVVKQNNEGILFLFKKNKVTFFHGRGSFVAAKDGAYEIKVAGKVEETISGKHVVVATGSSARTLPGTPFDEDNILSNDGALRIGAVPKKTRPDRLGRHRSGDGLCLAPFGRRGDGARRPAHFFGCGGPANRQGGAQGLYQAGPEDRAGREGRRDQVRQEGRFCRLHQRQGRSRVAGR